MGLTDEISTPYTVSFATKSYGETQSKAFERSVSNAPNTRPWSRDCLHFINNLIKQCCALKRFLNPH